MCGVLVGGILMHWYILSKGNFWRGTRFFFYGLSRVHRPFRCIVTGRVTRSDGRLLEVGTPFLNSRYCNCITSLMTIFGDFQNFRHRLKAPPVPSSRAGYGIAQFHEEFRVYGSSCL